MATVTITSENLEKTLTENEIVFLDFWASWCMPCQRFAPVFEEASERHPDIVFGKISTEEEQELAGAAGITSIPTIMVFKGGIPVFSQAGALPASSLDELAKQVRALDMAEVNAKAAEAAAATAPDPDAADN